MTELTGLGQTIEATESSEIKLDSNIKNILAYKPILARIFKEAINECNDMTYDEIMTCIEGNIEIDVVGLNPGDTNFKIEGRTQEDAVPNEGKVTFDIRTVLRIPKKETIGVKLLVDVEAQKDDTPGYDISERAIYYCCRMISSQLNVEFTNTSLDKIKYGNLKKVYSIWVCTETPQKRANTIERYRIKRDVYPDEKGNEAPRYDLMEAVIINISASHNAENAKSELIHLLTDLFNEGISGREKNSLLKEKYGLPTTEDFERRVQDMTAYAARMIRKGIEQGIEKEIFSSVQEGDYSPARGAEKLGMSLKDFLEKYEKAGYKLPVEV